MNIHIIKYVYVIIYLFIINIESKSTKRCFPSNFMIGSATASYQVEGGYTDTGRTPSIWDIWCRTKENIQCANVADDMIHRYQDDIKLVKNMGLNSFRFSISWSRVMRWNPLLMEMERNDLGIQFYHNLIDSLNKNNIEPLLTMYHWDLPQALQDHLHPGGWLNKNITQHFIKYSSLLFDEYGSKVNYWATFNEPLTFVLGGYGQGYHPPGHNDSFTEAYIATHNVLLSHANVVALFRKKFPKSMNDTNNNKKISIVLNCDYNYPLNPNNILDIDAAERAMEYSLGWYLSPITTGDYPKIMKKYSKDHLPIFTKEEKNLLNGSYDLFMLNHYTSRVVTNCNSAQSEIYCKDLAKGWERDLGIDNFRFPIGAKESSKTNNISNCEWFAGYPNGYLKLIKWMNQYNNGIHKNVSILLTENGWCGNNTIENYDQLWYHETYLNGVLDAILNENIPVIGYTAWSLLDNYEWGSFVPRFGLFYVNYTSDTGKINETTLSAVDALQRIPRPAAIWLSKVAKEKCIDDTSISITQIDPKIKKKKSTTGSMGFISLFFIVFILLIIYKYVKYPVKSKKGYMKV